MESRREIEISTGPEIQNPPHLSPNEKFYVIYSPMKFKLSIMLNLKLKIKLPDVVQKTIGLLHSLILQSLTIENSNA